MELLVSYNGPGAASSMCFPGVEGWLLWIGPSPSAMHGATAFCKAKSKPCQRWTADILPKESPADELFCVNILGTSLTHRNIIHWLDLIERLGWDYLVKRIKWKQELKENNTQLSPLVILMTFPVIRWVCIHLVRTLQQLKIWTVRKSFQNRKQINLAEEISSYSSSSISHKAIFYNHTELASGIHETFSGQFNPIQRKSKKKRERPVLFFSAIYLTAWVGFIDHEV